MTSRRLFDRQQFFFIVLIALIFSGALRLGLEFREKDIPSENCQCSKQDCTRHHLTNTESLFSESLQGSNSRPDSQTLPQKSVFQKSFFKRLEDSDSWELSSTEAPGFQNRLLNPSNFRLTIKLLTYNRPDSAERCFLSLENTFYGGDSVDLDVYVDHPFDDKRSKWSKSYEGKVNMSHEVLEKVEGLHWSHGQKRIHYRIRNGGIQPQWLESWWPSSVNEFAFVVEDDMELSPMFYGYFKHVIAEYYYNQVNFNTQVYGVSFQRQFFVPGIGGRSMVARHSPFLYQLIGTWGQFLFPVPWKQFRKWYDMRRYNESREPVLENLKTTQWWFNKGNKLWTPWIIKWALAEQTYNIYTSFPGNLSLSISHREIGANFRKNRKADAQLLTETDFDKAPPEWMSLPSMTLLDRYDFCYRKVVTLTVSQTLEELQVLIETIQEAKSVALIMVPIGAYDLIRNWLCHIEGLNLRNYVLIVLEENISEDLMKRGHPVYYLRVNKGLEKNGEEESVSVSTESVVEWGQEQLQLVLSVLAMGYNVVVCSPETVWVANPFPKLKSTEFDMQGFVDAEYLSRSFLFVRSSVKTIAAWDAFLTSYRGGGESSDSKSLSKIQSVASRFLSTSTSFQELHMAPLSSVIEGNLTYGTIPVILGPGTNSKQETIEKLGYVGLWVIDDYDFACKAVVCKKKILSS